MKRRGFISTILASVGALFGFAPVASSRNLWKPIWNTSDKVIVGKDVEDKFIVGEEITVFDRFYVIIADNKSGARLVTVYPPFLFSRGALKIIASQRINFLESLGWKINYHGYGSECVFESELAVVLRNTKCE